MTGGAAIWRASASPAIGHTLSCCSRETVKFPPLHSASNACFPLSAQSAWAFSRSSLWPELSTVLAVETIRGVTGAGKAEAEIRYFLTSCGDDPAVLAQAIRLKTCHRQGLEGAEIGGPFWTPPSRMRARQAPLPAQNG